MNNLLIFYLFIYVGFLSIFLFGGFSKLKRKNKLHSKKNVYDLNEITVVIPFRNEEKRINQFLDSVLNSTHQPSRFVFVNDHSSDNSVELILKNLKTIEFEILNLPQNKVGKKRAIELGVLHAKTKYVLTMDADVEFSNDYFTSLKSTPSADLQILPVLYKSKSYWNLFFQQDVLLANYMNFGISGWKRSIISSGANLLFEKSKFIEFSKKSNYFNLESGDDILLMRAFQENNLTVNVQTDLNLGVKTELARAMGEFINQRMRWLGKSIHVRDSLANALALIQFVFSILNWFFLYMCFHNLPIEKASTFVILKFLADWILTFSYYREFNYLKVWIFAPIYLLLLPILNLTMLCSFIGYKPVWKDRLIINQNV